MQILDLDRVSIFASLVVPLPQRSAGGELWYDNSTRARLERLAAAAMVVVLSTARDTARGLAADLTRLCAARHGGAVVSDSIWGAQPRQMWDVSSRSVVVALGGGVAVPYGFE